MPVRLQRKRQAGWRKPDNAVIVDRTSRWGNPYIVKQREGKWAIITNTGIIPSINLWRELREGEPTIFDTKEEAVAFAVVLYKRFVLPYTSDDNRVAAFKLEEFHRRNIIEALQGKDLVCFCSPDSQCHADILLEIANKDIP